MRQIMFMTSNCLVKAFTVCKATEMKAASPSIFVDVGCKVVIAVPINEATRAEDVEQHTALSKSRIQLYVPRVEISDGFICNEGQLQLPL